MKTNILEPNKNLNKRKFLYMGAAALVSLKVVNPGGAAYAEAATGKTADAETLKKEAQCARAYHEVQHLWSRHASYDAAGKRHEEINEIWAQYQPDVCWAENNGMWIGLDDIKRGYCEWFEASQKERFKKVKRLYPEIPDDPKYYLVGWNKMYNNMTPLIVVAGDGKTAKGAWDSVSYITDLDKARNIFIRYFVDFIKEGEQWKIWHANEMVCKWNEPVGDDYTSPNAKMLQEPFCDFPSIGEAVQKPPWSKAEVRCLMYDKDKFTGLLTPSFPRYPDPYYTFSETHSYGPDMFESWYKVDLRGPIAEE